MNERIRELHEQAFDWVQYQLQTVGSDHPVLQKEQLEMVNEKFAELIVQECMTICRKHPSRDLDNGWFADAVAPHLVQQFEEHFGVEESEQENFGKGILR